MATPKFFILLFFVVHGVHSLCQYEKDETTKVLSKTQMSCKIRTLERSSENFSNLGVTSQKLEVLTKFNISCNEMLLFESNIGDGLFLIFQALNELNIENCKFLFLPKFAFNGLSQLKKLSVKSNNQLWGANKNLNISQESFQGLNELQSLNLAGNNINLLQQNTLCPLKSLQTLNLTDNRIKSANELGFSAGAERCSGGEELVTLDLSYNRLANIGDFWQISKLRRLQQLHLQHNNITDVSSESLIGLTSLRILNLSFNKLESLPNLLLFNSREIREIHLQNNLLFELPKGLFHRLEQLLVLDLSSNQLSSHHIDENIFTGLIRLIVLNLSNNALTRIDSKTFKDLFFLQILDLKNNSIGYVDENAFLPLYNLHTLNLAENRLHQIDNNLFNGLFVLSKLTLNNNLINSIDINAFKNCSDLKQLDLSSNQITRIPKAIQDLQMLKSLDLGENLIENVENDSFKNLNQLTGLRLIDNRIGNLSKPMFQNLPNLQVLNLAENKIQQIDRDTFDGNQNLEAIRLDKNFLMDVDGIFSSLLNLLWLNLSENNLIWFDYAFVPFNLKWLDIHNNYIEVLGNYYKIQDKLKLKTLDASHNILTEISNLNIPDSVELLFINNNFIRKIHADSFYDKKYLTRIDLYANEIKQMDLNSLKLPKVLENSGGKTNTEIYLSGNPFRCDCSMDFLLNINNISNNDLITHRYPKIMDSENIVCNVENNVRTSKTLQLKTMKSSNFLCEYKSHCFALCHCCDFFACDCEMICPSNCKCLNNLNWSTNIVDCGSSANNGTSSTEIPKNIPIYATEIYLDGNIFQKLDNHVFIGRKNLQKLYLNSSNVEVISNKTFAGLLNLQTLDLSNNKLQVFKGFEFVNLDALKELYLQNNQLTHIDNTTFKGLTSLEVLRLDGNKLVNFVDLNMKTMQKIWLGLNQYACRCENLQKIASFVQNNLLKIQDLSNLHCVSDGVIQRLNIESDKNVCSEFYVKNSEILQDYIYLLATVLILFLLVILKICLHSKFGVTLFDQPEFDNLLYDVMILYSEKDLEYLQKYVLVNLKDKFKICLLHRDGQGTSVQENSENSKRLVLILTRNFLQTEWIKPNLRQVFRNLKIQKRLVVLKDQKLHRHDLDEDFKPFLKTAKDVKSTDDKNFTERLLYNLPKVGKNLQQLQKLAANTYTLENNTTTGSIRQQNCVNVNAKADMYDFENYEENNYSSATTCTPSPKFAKKNMRKFQEKEKPYTQRPNSSNATEHIYSSIDSDYSTLERRNLRQNNFDPNFGQHPPNFGQLPPNFGQVPPPNFGQIDPSLVGQFTPNRANSPNNFLDRQSPNFMNQNFNHSLRQASQRGRGGDNSRHVQAYLV
ncbi:toll-like receptor 7 [Ctenocephalides felis]|uniref:toll-like receptor 7 n=1 Tax=Ctenocephalides felis TaxID=7515 RepID=UPI000E6E3396|nr:toll-like receptor 7 [Ctenocephalides felis]XP_026475624.1 toll-like receptor 7 [Ctenocephalides felis]